MQRNKPYIIKFKNQKIGNQRLKPFGEGLSLSIKTIYKIKGGKIRDAAKGLSIE